MVRRPYNFSLAMVAGVIVCLLAGVVVIGAIALRGRTAAGDVLHVPSDFSSIQAAVEAAQPGDVIQVASGTYNGSIMLNKPVTLMAENFDAIYPVNNTTVLDGIGGAATIVIPPNMTQMPTIRGFVIRNGGTAVQAQSPLILEYNYLNAATYLVHYMIGSGGINRGNVYYQALDDAINLENTSRPLLIENNRIMYAGDDGIEISLQSNPSSPSITEIDIWNNMIIGSREDGIQFIDFASNPPDINRRFIIVGNLVANSKRAGIGLMTNQPSGEDYSGADAAEAIHVYNDTFYGNDVGISGGDNLVAFNNIIVNSPNRGVSRIQAPPGGNSIVAYSLFFNNGRDADQSSLGEGIITGKDPLFVSPPNPGPDGTWETVDDDFSGLLLRKDSPAIDRGVTQFIAANGEAIPAFPLTGFTGASPDLGWREYGSPLFMAPTATIGPTITLAPTNTSFVLTPLPSLTPVIPNTGPTATATPASLPTQTQPAPPASVIPSVPPTQPRTTATLGSPTVTPTPALFIQSILPVSAQAGTTVNITITGTGFVPDAVIIFEGGQGIPSEVTQYQVLNPQTIVITVDVMADSAYGQQVWDLRITNPDGTTLLFEDAFTVMPAP